MDGIQPEYGKMKKKKAKCLLPRNDSYNLKASMLALIFFGSGGRIHPFVAATNMDHAHILTSILKRMRPSMFSSCLFCFYSHCSVAFSILLHFLLAFRRILCVCSFLSRQYKTCYV